MGKRKRLQNPTMHARNKYFENPPDFTLLASAYPSFKPFVVYSNGGYPNIDWSDFNAVRELTRVLLLHDHGINWWIPDGQLCPTVPNRSNYLHWIHDLLSSTSKDPTANNAHSIRGFDIGTGSSCIYPLLGASLFRWNFVGSDVTNVALEWAEKNVQNNQHISGLIEVRKVLFSESGMEQLLNERLVSDSHEEAQKYCVPPVLIGVVRSSEEFDFCMCNPPFFESMEKAGLNPKTCFGGTSEEMVCPGGERAFVGRIIEDSVVLQNSFRWFTSMLGRKTNLKFLISKLWKVGASIVKTTQFVQGKTSRWGLAWSFLPPTTLRRERMSTVNEKHSASFMLEGIQAQCNALQVLHSVESFFCSKGASCKLDVLLFTIEISTPRFQSSASIEDEIDHVSEILCSNNDKKPSSWRSLHSFPSEYVFCVSVYQQIPGALLVKACLQNKKNDVSGVFSLLIEHLEKFLRSQFCRRKLRSDQQQLHV